MTVEELRRKLAELPAGFEVEVYYDGGYASTGIYSVNVYDRGHEVHLNESVDVSYTETE